MRTVSISLILIFAFSFLGYAQNCNCIIRDATGNQISGGRSCQNSMSACYTWCDRRYNPGGVFRTTISYSKGGRRCRAPKGNIYVKPHIEFKKGTEWITYTNYRFIFQKDGNLVLYNPKGRPLWDSKTNGKKAKFLAMQSDGNLVIYNNEQQPIWASNTHGNNGSVLAIQDDGNIVIYNSQEVAIWSTGTHGQ